MYIYINWFAVFYFCQLSHLL